MTTTSANIKTNAYQQAIKSACDAIAPTWPLDQMIAVNPLWKQIDQPFTQVAARLAALGKIQCLMPKEYYLDLWRQGLIQPDDLYSTRPQAELIKALSTGPSLAHWHNVSDLLDSEQDQKNNIAWRDEITHQVSQFCAAHFQGQGSLHTEQGLYAHWLQITVYDRGIALLMNSPKLMDYFKALPKDSVTLIPCALDELGVTPEQAELYCHALLLDINGWASWVAYVQWQQQLQGQNHQVHLMAELLAIRLAWELVLWRYHVTNSNADSSHLQALWQQGLADVPDLLQRHKKAQTLFWVWQEAAELSYQRQLESQLISEPNLPSKTSDLKPSLHIVFCIDVRSEPIRRALESQDKDIQTLGFAGFFGLPLGYEVAGTSMSRPQLPGLLAPAIEVAEQLSPTELLQRQTRLNTHARKQQWGRSSLSSFSMIETKGLLYAFKLVKQSFFPGQHQHPVNDLDNNDDWGLFQGTHQQQAQQPLPLEVKVDLVFGILHAMTLTEMFADYVVLAGHGSHTTNNAQAAGLDCGACGGQTGEINARVLAALLNEQQVRDGLRPLGIDIPKRTCFVPALHNTTTDEIRVFDHLLPDSILYWFKNAQQLCQQERAPKLGLDHVAVKDLHRVIESRSNDWSVVRPEWGLANNAAFIIAPRTATRHCSFEGRSFLHDYTWQNDTGFKILEAIMTAPMIVTHWINSQYNASVTDNLKYGSGNKLLHNVVGGHIGVFEGNGGDLRIGLALQSIHNGEQWMHQPLRLSVYIAAPKEAIQTIVESHQMVKNLVDNGWLYLHCLPQDKQGLERYVNGGWQHKRRKRVSNT